MPIKMKMSFVNKFENQVIEAFIQEDWHPAPKPMKIIFDRNSNLLLQSLPLTRIKPSFAPSSPPSSRLTVGLGQECTG